MLNSLTKDDKLFSIQLRQKDNMYCMFLSSTYKKKFNLYSRFKYYAYKHLNLLEGISKCLPKYKFWYNDF